MKNIGSGAEAIVILDGKGNILKDRIEKKYRIPEIDIPLRRSRTKKEAKVLDKLASLGMNVPKLLDVKGYALTMENIKGIQLKKILDDHPGYAELIGKNITIMHDNNIIHGDLTTSNMIMKDNKLYFIDFGLSFNSPRIEDKAVDIHLFKQALESRHFRVMDKAYKYFLKGYNAKDKKEVLNRLADVEARGRYKEKI